MVVGGTTGGERGLRAQEMKAVPLNHSCRLPPSFLFRSTTKATARGIIATSVVAD
jgi:hypothetical protein